MNPVVSSVAVTALIASAHSMPITQEHMCAIGHIVAMSQKGEGHSEEIWVDWVPCTPVGIRPSETFSSSEALEPSVRRSKTGPSALYLPPSWPSLGALILRLLGYVRTPLQRWLRSATYSSAGSSLSRGFSCALSARIRYRLFRDQRGCQRPWLRPPSCTRHSSFCHTTCHLDSDIPLNAC